MLTLVALIALSSPRSARAQSTATFGFENVSADQTTPFLGAAPDSGDMSFRADFTSYPDVNTFGVLSPFFDSYNAKFSGQLFGQSGGSNSTLTITFNRLVDGLSLDFAQNVRNEDPAGIIRVVTPYQTFDFPASAGTDIFQAGSLSIAGAIPFDTVQLVALHASGNPVAFIIDNLTVTSDQIAPDVRIRALIEQVQSLGLAKGIQNSLVVKLSAALSALSAGDTATAIAKLTDFINEVRAQSGKKITTAAAAALIEEATSIRTQLSTSSS